MDQPRRSRSEDVPPRSATRRGSVANQPVAATIAGTRPTVCTRAPTRRPSPSRARAASTGPPGAGTVSRGRSRLGGPGRAPQRQHRRDERRPVGVPRRLVPRSPHAAPGLDATGGAGLPATIARSAWAACWPRFFQPAPPTIGGLLHARFLVLPRGSPPPPDGQGVAVLGAPRRSGWRGCLPRAGARTPARPRGASSRRAARPRRWAGGCAGSIHPTPDRVVRVGHGRRWSCGTDALHARGG